ncbi:MAG: glycosyltransferase [Candidatus Omnitrophota bacterium]
MNFLFPYMARWKAINWSRYQQLFTRLAKMGHMVYVLQPPPSANLIETNYQEIEAALPEKLRLIDVEVNPAVWNRTFPLNKLVKKGYYTICSRKKVQEIVTQCNIDVLFLYNIPQYPLMNCCNCFKVFDYADDYRAMLEHELGRYRNRMILYLADFLLERMVKKSNMTLAISNILADNLRHTGADIKVLPNGADEDDFHLNPEIDLGLNYKKPVVGFLGSFEYFIDFDLILSVAGKMPEITFLLVGAGRDFTWVKQEVEKRQLGNVVLTGAVPHSQIAYYIKMMDICLNVFKKISVSHSACPLKLFEYLIMKKPVISSRLKEIEIINKNFVFYADTTEEMIETINMLLEDKPKAIEYGQRGYNATIREYTWNKIAFKLLDMITKIKGR